MKKTLKIPDFVTVNYCNYIKPDSTLVNCIISNILM